MNINQIERLWKLEASLNAMVLDGKRNPKIVADTLQKIIDEPEVKFALLKDLGVIMVPEGYCHSECISEFRGKMGYMFSDFSPYLTDDRFRNPTRIMKPGEKFRVRIFTQVSSGFTLSVERLEFLKSQKAVLVGAQGAALAFKQKYDQLPKYRRYISFDEESHLYKDNDGRHKVPEIQVRSDSDFRFWADHYERPWDESSRLLCFTEE